MKPTLQLLREIAHFTFFGVLVILLSPLILIAAIAASHHPKHPPTLLNRYQR